MEDSKLILINTNFILRNNEKEMLEDTNRKGAFKIRK